MKGLIPIAFVAATVCALIGCERQAEADGFGVRGFGQVRACPSVNVFSSVARPQAKCFVDPRVDPRSVYFSNAVPFAQPQRIDVTTRLRIQQSAQVQQRVRPQAAKGARMLGLRQRGGFFSRFRR